MNETKVCANCRQKIGAVYFAANGKHYCTEECRACDTYAVTLASSRTPLPPAFTEEDVRHRWDLGNE